MLRRLFFKFEENRTWNELRMRRNVQNRVLVAAPHFERGGAQCLSVPTLKHEGGRTQRGEGLDMCQHVLTHGRDV